MPRNPSRQFPVLAASIENDDVCSLVSIVPFLISEFKPGIYPGRFVINPCLDPNKPEILQVGTSIHFVPQFNGDEELPAIVVKSTCKDVATAVVNDYMSGQMDVNEECRPGLVFVPGKITSKEFAVHHVQTLLNMKKYQSNWFGMLVRHADNDWNRYKNHKVISDNQRFACLALGLEREWLTPNFEAVPIKCPSCLTNCMPQAVVCANCRCILKPEEYKKLEFAA